ncbi:acyloxyacyl hydrolase [Planctobacterium marinum]|uniref:acyloxyacyl hydrolase n=1 Tax=Planctobacterium marinum TaxID=1631968 RepID=UPI001E53828F|nr:acyloxyacyl hydrolase [Planctobacterium marinum]MCC2603809.1 acyloxyacyl hydrolase [Planctobacterium marinum]
MHNVFLATLMLITAAVFPASAQQWHLEDNYDQAISIEYLHGEGNLKGLRLGYRPVVTQIDSFRWLGTLDVYWEFSLNFWEFGDPVRHESNFAFAISPVFSKEFARIYDKYPVKWEFGIGVSLVEDTRFAGKDIGSHYQFEDRLGIIFEFGENLRESVALRYMHYSNGGLNDNNPGMDFANIAYTWHF